MTWPTCHSHSLRQAERDRLPICIMKLCHSLGVAVYLSQEHASAAVHAHTHIYTQGRDVQVHSKHRVDHL